MAGKKRKGAPAVADYKSKEWPPSIANAASISGSKKSRGQPKYDTYSSTGNKDYSIEESIGDDQRSITSFDTRHKSTVASKSIPKDVSATPRHQKVKGRNQYTPKKRAESFDSAVEFINNLTVK
jgi:hypothetical protein